MMLGLQDFRKYALNAGLACLLSVTLPACGQKAELTADVYVSSRAGDRIAHKAPVKLSAHAAPDAARFRVETDRTDQRIIGFGASFNEAGLLSLNQLPAADQDAVLKALFDTKTGAGFSAMKTVVAATDFMSTGPFYSYDDTPGDSALEHFSIARDLGPDGLVTYIRRARAHGSFILQATMDFPPDWMLIDGNPANSLAPQHFDTLARYQVRYLQAYHDQGIDIDYLSPFNEPTNYTRITYPQFRDYLKNNLGPKLKASGLKTQLQVSENPAGRYFAARNAPIILDDPEARPFVSSITYHGYDFWFKVPIHDMGDVSVANIRTTPPTAENGYDFSEFEQIRQLHERYPDLPLWMSEVCTAEMGDGASGPPKLPTADFNDGEFWGLQIASDLAAGASGWTYWNMILDQNGGPNLVAPEHGNPAFNRQQPVVIVDTQTKTANYTGLYYYLSHFSRFVRPGAERLVTDGSAPGIRFLAFRNPDAVMVLEAINTNSTTSPIDIDIAGRHVAIRLAAHSITTLTLGPPGTKHP